jgi:CheY-like chemotaxis protein
MQSKLILIVDDSDNARFVFGAILNYDGYRVLEASDGVEAVGKARDHNPDLILMDLDMPGMSGVETAQAIRELCPNAKPLIAAVTGFNPVEEVISAESMSLFDGCFFRPLSPARVLAEVQRMIGPPAK